MDRGFWMKVMLVTALLVTVLAVKNANAQSAGCVPYDALVQRLGEKYGEGRHGAGIAHNGLLLELFVNPDTGSWTSFLNDGRGSACPVATGTGWVVLDEAPKVGTLN